MAAGLIVYDLLFWGAATGIWGVAILAAREVLLRLWPVSPWLAVPAAVMATLVVAIAEVGVLSLLLPRAKPGRYEMMKGTAFWGWLLRSLLRRVLFVPGVKPLIFASNVLRFLALRAMGAKVAFTANMSTDVDLLDPWLLEVGAGATIGARCLVSGHYVEGGKLVLGEVVVGEKALLAAEVLVGPNVRIGKNVRALARAAVSIGCTVGDGAELGPGARFAGYNGVAAGAKVPAGAKLMKGESFPAEVGAREE